MQHVVLIFKWIFLFYSNPTPPTPPCHCPASPPSHLCFLFVLLQNALEVLTTSNCRPTMPLPRPPHSHTHTHMAAALSTVHPLPFLLLLSGCIITVIIIIFTIVCSISVLPCASGQPVNAFTHSHSHSYSRKPIGKSLRNPSTRVSLNTREGRCVSCDCWLGLFLRVIAWFGDLFVGQWMTCCLT